MSMEGRRGAGEGEVVGFSRKFSKNNHTGERERE